MPQICLTVRNDDGTTTEKVFDLGTNLNNLDTIDQAVELFKNEALLQKAQERIVAQEKKTLVEGQR